MDSCYSFHGFRVKRSCKRTMDGKFIFCYYIGGDLKRCIARY